MKFWDKSALLILEPSIHHVLGLVDEPFRAEFVLVKHVIDEQKAIVCEHHMEVLLFSFTNRLIPQHRVQIHRYHVCNATEEISLKDLTDGFPDFFTCSAGNLYRVFHRFVHDCDDWQTRILYG